MLFNILYSISKSNKCYTVYNITCYDNYIMYLYIWWYIVCYIAKNDCYIAPVDAIWYEIEIIFLGCLLLC